MSDILTDVLGRYGRLDAAVRSGKLALPDAVHRYAWAARKDLAPGTLSIANLQAADLQMADDANFAVPFTISTYSEDRDGDVVVPMGCRTHNYQNNPVIFFGHQDEPIPIAKAVGPDGKLHVFLEENRIRSTAFFDKACEDSMYIHGKIKRGFLSAASIAFVPIKAYRRDVEKAHQHESGIGGWVFEEVDMTEWSVVGVPSNPGATVEQRALWRESLDTEGRNITKRMRRCVGAFCEKSVNERGGCWTGWCPAPAVKRAPAAKSSCGCSGCKASKPCCKGKDTAKQVRKSVGVEQDNDGFWCVDYTGGEEPVGPYPTRQQAEAKLRLLTGRSGGWTIDDRRKNMRKALQRFRVNTYELQRFKEDCGELSITVGKVDTVQGVHVVNADGSPEQLSKLRRLGWSVWKVLQKSNRKFATQADIEHGTTAGEIDLRKSGSPVVDFVGRRLGGNGKVWEFKPSDQLVTIMPDSMRTVMACQTVAQQAERQWPDWNVLVLDPGRAKRLVAKYITHSGSKWVVHSESGKVLGTHDTQADAERQLRAVEANKHKSIRKNFSVGDRVVITAGPNAGKTGVVSESTDKSPYKVVIVRLDEVPAGRTVVRTIAFSPDRVKLKGVKMVRKAFGIGDRVTCIAGRNKGKSGVILEWDDDLIRVLFDDGKTDSGEYTLFRKEGYGKRSKNMSESSGAAGGYVVSEKGSNEEYDAGYERGQADAKKQTNPQPKQTKPGMDAYDTGYVRGWNSVASGKKSLRKSGIDAEYDQGYVAAWDGRPLSTNPYRNDTDPKGREMSADWAEGWRDGAKERLAGRKSQQRRKGIEEFEGKYIEVMVGVPGKGTMKLRGKINGGSLSNSAIPPETRNAIESAISRGHTSGSGSAGAGTYEWRLKSLHRRKDLISQEEFGINEPMTHVDSLPHEVAIARAYKRAVDEQEQVAKDMEDITPFDPATGEPNKAHDQLKGYADSVGERVESLKAMFGESSEKDLDDVVRSLDDEETMDLDGDVEMEYGDEETGEANLVDHGEVPELEAGEVDDVEMDLDDEEHMSEVGSPEWAAEEAMEPEHQDSLDDEEERDVNTDEILERYATGKGYGIRRASSARIVKVLRQGGSVATAKDGTRWLVVKAGTALDKNGKPLKTGQNIILDPGTQYESRGVIESIRGNNTITVRWIDGNLRNEQETIASTSIVGKSLRQHRKGDTDTTHYLDGDISELEDMGNPAELKSIPEEHEDTVKAAMCSLKGLSAAHDMPEHHKSALEMHGDELEKALEGESDDPAEAMEKAHRHMKSLAGAPDIEEHHKAELEHHADELAKALDDMGNPVELKDDGEEEQKWKKGVKKGFKVGDKVVVVSGPGEGIEGTVTSPGGTYIKIRDQNGDEESFKVADVKAKSVAKADNPYDAEKQDAEEEQKRLMERLKSSAVELDATVRRVGINGSSR